MLRKCAILTLTVFVVSSLAGPQVGLRGIDAGQAGDQARSGQDLTSPRSNGFSSERRREGAPKSFGWGWYVAGAALVGGVAALGIIFWDQIVPESKTSESPGDKPDPVDPGSQEGSLTFKWK